MKQWLNIAWASLLLVVFAVGCTSQPEKKSELESVGTQLADESKREVVQDKILHISYKQEIAGDGLETVQKMFVGGDVVYLHDQDSENWKAFSVTANSKKYQVLVAKKDVFISENEVDLELLLQNFFK